VTFAVKNGDAGAEFPRYPCRAAPKRRTRSDQGWLRSDQLGAERRFYFGVTSYRRAYAGFKGFGCGTAVAWSWDLCTGLPEQPREERAGKVLPKFCLALHIQVASLVLEPIRRTGYGVHRYLLTTPDLEPPSCLPGTQCDQGLTCKRVRALLGCCLRGLRNRQNSLDSHWPLCTYLAGSRLFRGREAGLCRHPASLKMHRKRPDFDAVPRLDV